MANEIALAMAEEKERLETAITLGNSLEAEKHRQMYLWLKELDGYRQVVDDFRSDSYSRVSKTKYFDRIIRIRGLME